ncbi:MFS general substrate transporter [Acaromyces ingoldii]|uniref:MFS general substrate transporter n=1 Tax=Acaromyces ingoldii TaxID=215250 RepID=A0A316YCD6_9BASI|nr:MFS general substrate transporter [Acaromyces ingoldii]PWN86899.1 MFS general substrate transporter [Acaromyces ingoldii]
MMSDVAHTTGDEVVPPLSSAKDNNTTVKEHELFRGKWQLYTFVGAILLGQGVNMMPFGATLSSQLIIARELGVADDAGQITWIVAAFSMTAAFFVLIGGRLSDIYGPRIIWQASMAWMMVWNLVTSFARSPPFFDACRGLAGISSGMLLPAGIGLLARCYPPGVGRAVVFGLFGALAPFSAAGGSIFETLLAQLVSSAWIWRLLAFKCALTLLLGILAMPLSIGQGGGGSLDVVGAFLGAAGLLLFNFAFSQSTVDDWGAASISTLVVGLALLFAFALWESFVAKEPILPFDIWKAPTFGWVLLSAFLGFMTFGVWVIYASQFFLQIRHLSPLLTQAYWTPFTLGAFFAALLGAFLVRTVPAQVIFLAGLVSLCLSNILMATAPERGIYWTYPFFSTLFAALGPDFIFTATQLIASNTVKASQQGVAGSLVGTVLNVGLALGAGLGANVELHVNAGGTRPFDGKRGAFYLAIGLAVTGMMIVVAFVRLPKDGRVGYEKSDEEKQTATPGEEERV